VSVDNPFGLVIRKPGIPKAVGIEDDETLETPPDADPELDLMRTQQRYALEDLMNGATYTEAARNAGVDRKTMYRWINHDPVFRAALAGWRRRAVQHAQDRLTQATETAAETLIQAATQGDVRAATTLLKDRGLLPGPARPETPPAPAGASAGPAPAGPVHGGWAESISVQILSILEHLVPPDKRREFEGRLRDLILSVRGEADGFDEYGAFDEVEGPAEADQLAGPAEKGDEQRGQAALPGPG
jgi:transposase-like protein